MAARNNNPGGSRSKKKCVWSYALWELKIQNCLLYYVNIEMETLQLELLNKNATLSGRLESLRVECSILKIHKWFIVPVEQLNT